MERRKFLATGLGAVAAAMAAEGQASDEKARPEGKRSGKGGAWARRPIGAIAPDPTETILNVKPVLVSLHHTDWWEGPCRPTGLSHEKEVAASEKALDAMRKMVREGSLARVPGVRFLEPAHVIHDERFQVPQEGFDLLARDAGEADVFLMRAPGSTFAVFDISLRFGKPWIVQGLGYESTTPAAYTRTYGGEGYPVADQAELIKTLELLRARKVLQQTRVLYPNPPGTTSASMATSSWNLHRPEESIKVVELLKNRLGVEVKFISYMELAEEVERLIASKEANAKAEQAADALLRQANKSFIDRQYVVRSFLFKEGVETLMARHGCNAFTVGCFEFCAGRLPLKWKIVPCMILSLMRDQQRVGSCEGDLGALVTMRMLMSVSGKACTMGNGGFRGKDAISIVHSVPCTRMNGFDQPGLPYQLGRFTNTGFGTKLVVDYMNNVEKTVTVARIGLDADKLLVMRGTLTGSGGWNKDALGCSVEAVIKPPQGDAMHFLRRRLEYGQHLSWVYGDYTEELRQLGEMLKIDVEVIA